MEKNILYFSCQMQDPSAQISAEQGTNPNVVFVLGHV